MPVTESMKSLKQEVPSQACAAFPSAKSQATSGSGMFSIHNITARNPGGRREGKEGIEEPEEEGGKGKEEEEEEGKLGMGIREEEEEEEEGMEGKEEDDEGNCSISFDP